MKTPLVALFCILTSSGCAVHVASPARGGTPWRELTSDHFLLQTDLDSEHAREVVARLEEMRAALIEAFSDSAEAPEAGRLLVVAFANRREFLWYGAGSDDVGRFVCDDHRRPRILLSSVFRPEGRRAVAHELAHYLMYQAVIRQPRWFAEGMAVYLETVADRDLSGRVSVGGLPEFARNLALDQRSVRSVLEWQNFGEEELPFYASSWLLVHYLLDVRPEDFEALRERLARAEDPRTAWNATFPEWSLDLPGATEELDRKLTAYRRAGNWRQRELKVLEATPRIAERPLSPSEVYSTRLALRRSWKPDELDAEIREALVADPDHVQALAREASDQKRPAEPLARRAVSAHPEDPEAWVFLGRSLAGANAESEEVAAFRRALELDPEQLEGLIRLAKALVAQGRAAEASPFALRALRIAPWSAPALWANAAALNAEGRCREAVSSARRAFEMTGMVDVSRAAEFTRNWQMAQIDWMENRCGDEAASAAYGLVLRASELRERSRTKQAASVLATAAREAPQLPGIWLALGDLYSELGRIADASVASRAHARVFPMSPVSIDRDRLEPPQRALRNRRPVDPSDPRE